MTAACWCPTGGASVPAVLASRRTVSAGLVGSTIMITEDIFYRRSTDLIDSFPEFESLIGWMANEEAEVLFAAAKQVSDGVIVEVGSAAGKSTVALSKGSAAGHGVPVFAIDPHEEFVGVYGGRYGPHFRKAFYETMLASGCWNNVRLVNLSSEIVHGSWPRPVGLLWIDGDHRYDGVRRDVGCWLAHTLVGSLIIFDDATNPDSGPGRVISELCNDGRARRFGQVGKIVAVQKL